jgi:hypothetical protein
MATSIDTEDFSFPEPLPPWNEIQQILTSDAQGMLAALANGFAVNTRMPAYPPEYNWLDDPNLLCEGDTLLHEAARRGFGNVVCALLRAGADVYAENICGHTPLYYARMTNHANIATMLGHGMHV